jgi:hypothetical protein
MIVYVVLNSARDILGIFQEQAMVSYEYQRLFGKTKIYIIKGKETFAGPWELTNKTDDTWYVEGHILHTTPEK